MGTGWFAADAANVSPGKTVTVVGDGAVGLLGVRLGTVRIKKGLTGIITCIYSFIKSDFDDRRATKISG
jgi:hypothetical protein